MEYPTHIHEDAMLDLTEKVTERELEILDSLLLVSDELWLTKLAFNLPPDHFKGILKEATLSMENI